MIVLGCMSQGISVEQSIDSVVFLEEKGLENGRLDLNFFSTDRISRRIKIFECLCFGFLWEPVKSDLSIYCKDN